MVLFLDNLLALESAIDFLLQHTSPGPTFPTSLEETTLTVSRLNNAILRLSTLHAQYEKHRADLHNAAYAPILRLPSEIYGLIFELALRSHNPTPDPKRVSSAFHSQVYRLSHVCSRWREVTMSSPLLFTHLDLVWLRRNSLTDFWIQKSGQHSLLNIYNANDEDIYIIRSIAPRIRYFRFDGDFYALGDVWSPSFPRLEALFGVGWDADLVEWDVPALRQMSLCRDLGGFVLPQFILSRLRFLSLHLVGTYRGISEILVSLERLEALELVDVRWSEHDEDTDDEESDEEVDEAEQDGGSRKRQSLASLQHLRVDSSSHKSIKFFFRSWLCPVLKTFYYSEKALSSPILSESRIWPTAYDCLQHSPQIHTLTFDLTNISSLHNGSLLMLWHVLEADPPVLPHLRALRVFGTSLDYEAVDRGLAEFIATLYRRHLTAHGLEVPSLTEDGPPLFPTMKAPVRLEIEDERLMERYRDKFPSSLYPLLETIELVFHPYRHPFPEWYPSI